MARPTTGIAYFVLILTVLGGFTFTVFVTIPAWTAWRAAERHAEATVARRAEQQTFLENIDARAAELKEFATDARILGVMFPDTPGSAEIFATFQSLANRTGVFINQVSDVRPARAAASPTAAAAGDESPETPAAGAGTPSARGRTATQSVTPYELSVEVRGTYAQVRAFVVDLERTLRFFDVPAIDFTKGRTETGEEAVTGKVTLRTYLLSEREARP